MRSAPATVWYLEMASPDDLRPARLPDGDVRVARAEVPLGALNRMFYAEVGRGLHWVDRLAWDAARWQAWVERVETWVVHDRGTPAGFAELEPRDDGSVDLAIFGAMRPFHGRGLGGHLLSRVVARAWELADGGTVTVNTCSFDGPHARRNYESRGFVLVREAVEQRRREG